MKIFATVYACIWLPLFIWACSAPNQVHTIGSTSGWYKTGDGRIVWCIRSNQGISCDWANARPQDQGGNSVGQDN